MPNFYNRFLQSVEHWPDAIAVEMQRQLVDSSRDVAPPLERYTYRELRAMSDAVGRWLLARDLEPGSRCALLAANGPRWVGCYLGAIAAGMTAVPLDTAFNAEQVAKLLAASGASLLFVDAKHLPVAEHAIQKLHVWPVLMEPVDSSVEHTDVDAILRDGSGDFTPAAVDDDDIAAILYTSGTTSDPKGVMLTHANFSAESDAVFNLIHITPRDAILGVLPLFHALAQMANLLLPLAAGARVVFLEALNTTELLRALRERDVTVFCCVPQFFYLIHERIQKEVGARGRLAQSAFRWMLKTSGFVRKFGINLGPLLFRPVHRMLGPRMRYLVTGGSRLDPSIGRDFEALGFALLQAYGLTETSGGATVTPPDDVVMGSVGKPLGDVQVRIHDPKPPQDGAAHSDGEILLRGGIVMKGYYNRPDATGEVLRDGWLYTGDLGYIDPGGNLFITGRQKEVIVLSSGKNIYPEEIEAHYLKTPYIKEICVMGLESLPGEPYAERLHAVVVPNFEVLRERKIVNAREVIRFDIENLSAQMPSTKRVLSFEIWQEDLPRTTTRKIKRFEVERRVRQGQAAAGQPQDARALSADDRAWLAEPQVARAIGVIRSAVKSGAREIHPRDSLELDLGLDSMERVELLVALERELGAHVPDSAVSEVYNVHELVDLVRGRIGSGDRGHERAAWDTILKTDPTEPEVLAITRRMPIAERWWHVFSRVVGLFARDFFSLKVTGLEKLPKRGPYIIAPNHQSFLDPPVLVSTFPYSVMKDIFFVGTSEIFGSGLAKRLARTMRLVPVDPDANLVPAMRAGAYGLRHGKILVLYPEGERSIDGKPRAFKKGAAILATHLNVPIYPVAMDGFYEAWPRGKRFQKFTKLKIAFGDPLYPPKQVDNPELAYERLTAELKSRVTDMWLELRNGRRSAVAAD